MHFACAKRVLDEVHFGGAFSPARRVAFRKSGNVQNVRVLRGVQNRRKGCSKLEVVTKSSFFVAGAVFGALEVCLGELEMLVL